MPEEIPIIPEEEIIQEIIPIMRSVKKKERRPKGMIDIDTYNQLKGILDTGNVVIGQIPLERAKKMDIEVVKHLESLTNNALSILENTNIVEHVPPRIPIMRIHHKRTHQEIDRILTNMKNELNYADKLVKDCDPRSIQVMSGVGEHMEKYRDLSSESDYRKLLRDSKKLNEYFIDLCKCKPFLIKNSKS